MDYVVFIHLSITGHLGCFYLLAIGNRAAVKVHLQVSVWTYVFISLGHENIGPYRNL
jgi:hypothetical protein